MADDDNNNSYWNGGTLAGSITGAAAGVALISHPGAVLGLLGVSAPAAAPAAPAMGLMYTAFTSAAPVAEAAVAMSAGAIALTVAGLAIAGALIGGMIVKHYRNKHAAEHPHEVVTKQVERSQTISVPQPSLEPQQQTSVEWAKQVEKTRSEAAAAGRAV